MTNQGKLLLMTLMTTRTQTVYSIQAIKIKSVKSLISPSLALHLSCWELLVAYSILRSLPHRKSDENYDYQNGPGSLPLLMNKLKVDKIKTPSKIRPREPLRTSTKV